MIRVATSIYRRLDGSLRARLVVPLALLMAASLAVMAFTALQLHLAAIEREQRERAMLFMTLAASSITEQRLGVTNADLATLVAVLRQHQARVDSISILDQQGLVRSSSEENLAGTRLANVQLDPTRTTTSEGDSYYSVVSPITLNEAGSPRALMELRVSNHAVEGSREHLAAALLRAAVPSVLLWLAVSWFLLGREAVRPIQRLVDAMRRAGAGEPARADNGRPDQIGEASRRFDATMDALQASRADLERVYQERMVRADRFSMVGQMASGLAHEIKNPLAGLSGALELLAEDLAGTPPIELVVEMQHQVRRLQRIMEGMLSFARPPKAQLRDTDVGAALEKVLFLVGQQRRGSPVEINRDLTAALPMVRADPAQLEQVFLNICLNAFQAINDAGTLRVRTFIRGGEVVTEFADSGPGIPTDVRPHIFTPFFTTRPTGTGLGLAICHRLVSEHGGTLSFDCPPTGGTVFTVALPIRSELSCSPRPS